MITRCEYCGQLYEGLSCPHCCAPRGEQNPIEQKSIEQKSIEHSDIFGRYDCPEWILTNSSVNAVGNNNMQVIGDNNTVNGFYADNVLYWVDHDVCLDDQHKSERDECTTDAYDEHVEDELEKVDDTYHAEKRCNKDEVSQDVLLAVITWLGVCSMSMIIGMPIILSIVIATAFCGILFGLMNINNCDD